MVKAIFFDLDNTLIDTRASSQDRELKVVKKVIDLYELENKQYEYLPLFEKARRICDKIIDKGRYPGESIQEFGVRVVKAKFAGLIELMGGEPDEKSIETVFRAHLEGIATAALFPEVKGVLKVFKRRHRLGLLSNNIVEVRDFLKPLGLQNFFNLVVLSGEENKEKPDPDIFHRAMKRIGVIASEAMMVGDSLLQDITGAKGVGMTAVWVNRYGEEPIRNIKPDYTIRDLRELLDIISRRRRKLATYR